MHTTAQEFQNQAFINSLSQHASHCYQSKSKSSLHQQPSSYQSQASLSTKSSNRQYAQRDFPHYWPADRVPYLGKITYCECIQYVFALLFVTVIIWIFVGLKNFEHPNQSQSVKVENSQQKSHKNQNRLTPEVIQEQIRPVQPQRRFQTRPRDTSRGAVKPLLLDQDRIMTLHRTFTHNSESNNPQINTVEIPRTDPQEH